MRIQFLLVIFLLLSFTSVAAIELTDDTNAIGVNINPVVTTSSASSGGNATGWNTTSLGVLTDASSSQFSNSGGTLTILTSYLNAGWCALTGCTMAGDIDMGGNDILNVGAINATTGNFTDIYVSNNSIYIGDSITLSASGSTLNVTGGNVTADTYFGSGAYLTDLNLTGITFTGGNITADYFFGDGSGLTGVGGLWTNVSNVATYAEVNVTGNLTRAGCTIWHNGTLTIEDC